MKIDPQIEEPVESLTFEEEGPLISTFSHTFPKYYKAMIMENFFFHNDYGAHNSKAS